MSLKRREVLQWAAAVPVAAWMGASAAAAPARALWVCDDERLRLVLGAAGSRVKVLPADVDCVRFARECLSATPEVIHGALRPGSFLVLSGTAEEAGFRLREEGVLSPQWPDGRTRITFSMQHRSALRGV
jgi:hypothetical protein